MFSESETAFILGLARDYAAVRNKQVSLNHNPGESKASGQRDLSRVLGPTDYGKFEAIAKSTQEEENAQDFEYQQDQAAQWCTVDHIHGPSCKPVVPGCSHDLSNERSLFEKSYEDKLSSIKMFREEGNDAYRSKEYAKSLVAYQRAITYLDYTFGETPDQDKALDNQRFKCHLNLAAVRIETQDYRGAINDCRIAIGLEPSSCKAFYRRGLAHLKLGELEDSQKDLYQAMKLGQTESRDTVSTIENAIRELNLKWREYKRKSSVFAKAAIS